MKKQFSLFRHPWEATGSGDARSLQNAMGKTSLDLWNVLLRESLQNSYDARVGDSIGFAVADTELGESETSILVNEIFATLPPEGASTKLRQMPSKGRIRVLTISDYGTRGLGGPLRANIAPSEGERSDFVDFIRNFGRSERKGLEGGTYGLGKGVLFQASRIGVCLVYSQTQTQSGIDYRLIGVSGGDGDYVDSGYKYTGRNWWGVLAADDIIDPMTGIEAREMAMSVGFPVPAAGESGTSIMVLAPELFNLSEEDILIDSRIQALRDAAVRWAWPLALDDGNGPKVRFRFSLDGVDLKVIHPLDEPLVKHFAQGYVDWLQYKKNPDAFFSPFVKIYPVSSFRPAKKLGSLVMRVSMETHGDAKELQNHVALLRKPRMVVKYLPATAPPSDHTAHSVFIADDLVDPDFASSEPVTHDDWIVQTNSKRGTANFVRIALNRIGEIFRDLHAADPAATAAAMSTGATKIAAELGGLVGQFSGSHASSVETNTGQRSIPNSRPSGSRRVGARLMAPPKLTMIGDRPHVEFRFQVQGGQKDTRMQLTASPQIVTDGGSIDTDFSTENPLDLPEFVGWRRGNQIEIDSSSKILFSPPTEEIFTAIFTQPINVAVKVAAHVEEVSS